MRNLLIPFIILLSFCTGGAVAAVQDASTGSSAAGAVTASTRADDDPDVLATRAADAQIQRKLASQLGLIDDLAKVEAKVTARVVTLRGEVPGSAERTLAEKMTRALPEVLDVRNQIQVTTAVEQRLTPTLERSLDRLQRLLASLPILLIAIAVVWLFNWIGRRLSRADALYGWMGKNTFLRELVRQAVRLVAVVLGLLLGLDLLGATAMVGAVLGTAGVVGLAVGFAFKDLIENYIASVLLSLRQPFAPNDHVVIDGEEGKVVSLTPRATLLVGMDGALRMLPNATVFKSVIVNYSRNPQRRLQFELGIRPGQPLAHAHRVLLDALAGIDGLLTEPAPSISTVEFGDARVTLRVSAWVDQRSHSLDKVRSQAIRICSCALETAGIAMPESSLRLLRNPAVQAATQPAPAPAAEPLPTATAPPAADEHEDTSVERHLDKQAGKQRALEASDDLLEPAAAPRASAMAPGAA